MQYILFIFGKQKEKSCLGSGHHQPLLNGKEQHELSAKHLLLWSTNRSEMTWGRVNDDIFGWTISLSKISKSRPLLESGWKTTTYALSLDNHWRFLHDKPIEKFIEDQFVYIYLSSSHSLSTSSKMHAIFMFLFLLTTEPLNMYFMT